MVTNGPFPTTFVSSTPGVMTMRRMVLPVLVMMLVGCSGEPDPPEETASPTPEITAPALPELADDDSPAGAEAFARHYIEVLNYASATGDTDPLDELSSEHCSGCRKYIDLYRSTYEDGGFFKDSDWKVEESQVWKVSGGYDVALKVSTVEGTSRASSTDQTRVDPAFTESIILLISPGSESPGVLTFDRVEE